MVRLRIVVRCRPSRRLFSTLFSRPVKVVCSAAYIHPLRRGSFSSSGHTGPCHTDAVGGGDRLFAYA